MQTVRKVFFYLLNPLAAQHQRTAYLSATVMSSNRPGTVVNTHRQTCHTLVLQGTLLTRCFLCDSHELKLLLIRSKFVVPGVATMMAVPLPCLTIELKECRRRIACPYSRVLCPPLCAACRARRNTHTRTHTQKIELHVKFKLLTDQSLWSAPNYFNLHPTSGTGC